MESVPSELTKSEESLFSSSPVSLIPEVLQILSFQSWKRKPELYFTMNYLFSLFKFEAAISHNKLKNQILTPGLLREDCLSKGDSE